MLLPPIHMPAQQWILLVTMSQNLLPIHQRPTIPQRKERPRNEERSTTRASIVDVVI